MNNLVNNLNKYKLIQIKEIKSFQMNFYQNKQNN